MAQFTPTIQQWILASEGGYVDHPKDPGGATNMGITHRTLAAWRGRPVTKQDVRNLTRDEALRIYKAQYWDTVKGDQLPAGLDYAVFDYAVNSGPARAARDLQRVLGVAVDGVIGVQTLAAINAHPRPIRLIEDLCERRLNFVKGLSTWSTFGRGWQRRIMGEQLGSQPGQDTGVIDRAVKLALGTQDTAPTPQPAPGKANPEQPSPVDTILKDPGGLSGLAGGAAALFGALADQPILQVAAVVFIGFLLWRFVISRKKEAA